MVYKRIKRGGGSAGPTSESAGTNGRKAGGPNDRGQFKKNQRGKIGEATAKRMQDKLGKLRKKKNNDNDDEIASNDSDAFIDQEPNNPKNNKRNDLLNDPFLTAA